jgi:glycosyltransferase involved in cell wall biosynthesis
MNKSDIWLVVPVFNEDKYLDKVLNKISKVTKNYIVVDDGSCDKSVEIAQKHTKEVLIHKLNLGKGGALKTGSDYAFKYLDAKAVIFIDSDDQHDPKELKLFYDEFKDGAQVVFGERKMDSKMPMIRVLGNKFASILVNLFFGSYVPDIPSGFKALSKSSYQKIRWQETGYGVELEIAARVAKYRIPFSVVPISTIYHDLDRGMTILDAFKICFKLLNLKITI